MGDCDSRSERRGAGSKERRKRRKRREERGERSGGRRQGGILCSVAEGERERSDADEVRTEEEGLKRWDTTSPRCASFPGRWEANPISKQTRTE